MSTEPDPRPLVLVADDDPDVLELVAFRLRRAGCEVITATDGEEALGTARHSNPVLAVLDVMMPGLNGNEVTRALREDDATSEMAILLLTASVQESDLQSGLDAGADEYMRKPFDPKELAARVEALLAKRGQATAGTSGRSRRA